MQTAPVRKSTYDSMLADRVVMASMVESYLHLIASVHRLSNCRERLNCTAMAGLVVLNGLPADTDPIIFLRTPHKIHAQQL